MSSVKEETLMNAGAVNPRRLSWSGLVKGLLLASAACAAFALGEPGRAEAGTYRVIECTAQNPFLYNFTYLHNTGSYFPYPGDLACPNPGIRVRNGGAVSVPSPQVAYGQWYTAVPAGTELRNIHAVVDLVSGSGHVAYVTVPGSANWYGPQSGTINTGVAGKEFAVGVSCGGSCPLNTNVHAYARDLWFDIKDVANPQVAGLGGSLMLAGERRGTENLEIAGTDAGGGVRRATVEVNGVQVASPDAGCYPAIGGFASNFYPCPSSATLDAQLNTEIPPWREGQNSVQACVEDFFNIAGPANRDCAQFSVTINNSCEGSPGPQQATAMSAGLETRSGGVRPSAVVRSDESATVRGQLIAPGGGVGGATVCLYERVAVPGQGRSLVERRFTRPDGTFQIPVDPGPSRTFDVVYRFNNQTVEKRQLILDSIVVPTLKVNPKKLSNGKTTRFGGAIPQPYAGNRAISLQARAGQKWRTFKQLKSNDEGRFKGRYKFTHTQGRVRYTFRVRVKQQNGYPYLPGTSKKKKVLVRG
jgi:hypothetical protein